ncbi:MAG: hypothetical protein IKR38_02010 [Bacteroidales bacterium]|nr:hypothetical protein [Bacteroidales bacterium]
MKKLLLFLLSCIAMACEPDSPTRPVVVDGGNSEGSNTIRPRTKSPFDDDRDTLFNLPSSISQSVFFQAQRDTLYELPNGIVLEKHDSLYYWGDMVFGEDGLDFLCPGRNRAAYKDITNYYWTNGVVYYCFNTNLPSTTTITDAMSELSSLTGVIFTPKPSGATKYIEFKYANKNDSKVGMHSGGQIINLYNYNHKTTIEHEIMHALGFFHEQERVDRDDYITIKWLNINPLKWHNFRKYNFLGQDSGIDFQSFDFDSIMLYDSYTTDASFAINVDKPIMTRINGTTFNGGLTLSSGDIAGIRSIYGPPYHRLERHHIRVVEDSVSGFSERYVLEKADSLVFYADRSCTIRLATSYPRLIGIESTCEYFATDGLHTESTSGTITVPAGVSSICLQHWYDKYIYYCSDPAVGYEVYNYNIINSHVPNVQYYHY